VHGNCTIATIRLTIGLLDTSAAFFCVDHSILLQRLERNLGITGLALQWATSYITGRTQQVLNNGKLSQLQRLSYSVLQGSVLGPLLFNLYTADISKVVKFTVMKCISMLTTANSIAGFLYLRLRLSSQ